MERKQFNMQMAVNDFVDMSDCHYECDYGYTWLRLRSRLRLKLGTRR